MLNFNHFHVYNTLNMLWLSMRYKNTGAHTDMWSILDVLVHFLMHFLISQSTHHAVLRIPSDTDYHPPSFFSSFSPSLPAGPELIVFALLINLTPPQGMSHIGFWMNMGCADTKTCPAFSNEFQPLRALGELACCDWHLLRRTVSLAEGTLTLSYSNQQWEAKILFDLFRLWCLMLQMFHFLKLFDVPMHTSGTGGSHL